MKVRTPTLLLTIVLSVTCPSYCLIKTSRAISMPGRKYVFRRFMPPQKKFWLQTAKRCMDLDPTRAKAFILSLKTAALNNMENELRPVWNRIFHFDWKFGLF